MVDGVRRALRFLFEAEQYQLEQALREELSNTQVGYLMHCFSSLWEDSDEASSAATSLDVPDLADVEHRTGRARTAQELTQLRPALGPMPRTKGTFPSPDAAPGYVFGPPGPLLGDDTGSSESEPDAEILGPAVPPGESGGGPDTAAPVRSYREHWPSDPYDDQWRASRELTLCRFPWAQLVPGTLPPLHMWPYFSVRRRLAQRPHLAGSLACQYPCPTCRARVCGRDQRPGRFRGHRNHECDECHHAHGRASVRPLSLWPVALCCPPCGLLPA